VDGLQVLYYDRPKPELIHLYLVDDPDDPQIMEDSMPAVIMRVIEPKPGEIKVSILRNVHSDRAKELHSELLTGLESEYQPPSPTKEEQNIEHGMQAVGPQNTTKASEIARFTVPATFDDLVEFIRGEVKPAEFVTDWGRIILSDPSKREMVILPDPDKPDNPGAVVIPAYEFPWGRVPLTSPSAIQYFHSRGTGTIHIQAFYEWSSAEEPPVGWPYPWRTVITINMKRLNRDLLDVRFLLFEPLLDGYLHQLIATTARAYGLPFSEGTSVANIGTPQIKKHRFNNPEYREGWRSIERSGILDQVKTFDELYQHEVFEKAVDICVQRLAEEQGWGPSTVNIERTKARELFRLAAKRAWRDYENDIRRIPTNSD
jgi:hypothetical protein